MSISNPRLSARFTAPELCSPEPKLRDRRAALARSFVTSVNVQLNGVMLLREDFLKDSVYTKMVNGVRIGVFQGGSYNTHCNFHGSVTDIRTGGGLFRLESVILPTEVRYALNK